jgi:hypothetical protein
MNAGDLSSRLECLFKVSIDFKSLALLQRKLLCRHQNLQVWHMQEARLRKESTLGRSHHLSAHSLWKED